MTDAYPTAFITRAQVFRASILWGYGREAAINPHKRCNPDGQAATWPIPGYPQIFVVRIISKTPLVLELDGRNLPIDSKFKVGSTPIDDTKLPPNDVVGVEMDELWNPPRFAKTLKLTIKNPDAAWTNGQQTLELTTSSGFSATCKIPAN